MPILNSTNNIPGMMVQFKDGGLALRVEPTPPSTRSVLILGTAVDGPVMNPVAIDSATAEAIFGKSVGADGRVNGASIPEAFTQLWKEGCRDIRVMRVTGAVAKATIQGGNISTVEQLKSGEELGTFAGCSEISKTLAHFPVVLDSLVVKTKKAGRLVNVMPSKYTLNHLTGAFHMAKDVVEAHVDLIATNYKYYRGVTTQLNGATSADVAITETIDPSFVINQDNEMSMRMVVTGSSADMHIVNVTTTKPNIAGATLNVTLDDGHHIAELAADGTLQWGMAPTGFPLVTGMDQVTNITVKANKVGTYTINMKLVNLTNPGPALIEKTFTIVITEESVINEMIITAAANVIEDQEFILESAPISIDGKLQFALVIGGISIDGQLLNAINSIRPSSDQLTMDDLFMVDDTDLLVKSDNINHKDIRLGSAMSASYYYIENDVTEIATMEFESAFGGNLYNQISIEVRDINDTKEVVIEKPLSKKASSSEPALVYSSTKYPTFREMIDAINNDANNNVIRVSSLYPDAETSSLDASAGTAPFAGGNDGVAVTKQQLFEALSGGKLEDGSADFTKPGAYKLLQNYKVDYITPRGVYADDQLLNVNDSFGYELALVCGVLSQVHMTHGIISMKPPKKTDLESLENYVKALEAYPNVFLMKGNDGSIITDPEGNPYDLGGYISVIAGPELVVSSSRVGTYNYDAAVKYAAFESRKKVSSAPTNKKVESISGMRFSFSVPQLNRLNSKRYVTLNSRLSDNAIVYTDGVTAALPNSDWSRIVNIDVVRACLDDIYAAAEPFIGEPPSLSSNNALSAAIDKKLLLRKDPLSGDIENYSFSISNDNSARLIGESKLELTLVPLGERRKITIVVGLKPAL